MVGETKIYQGQRVQVMGVVNGDEVVVQFADGSRQPVLRSDLTDPPKPASNRPIITKGVDIGPGTGGADAKEPDDEKPVGKADASGGDAAETVPATDAAPTEPEVPTVVPEQLEAPADPTATEPPAPAPELPF